MVCSSAAPTRRIPETWTLSSITTSGARICRLPELSSTECADKWYFMCLFSESLLCFEEKQLPYESQPINGPTFVVSVLQILGNSVVSGQIVLVGTATSVDSSCRPFSFGSDCSTFFPLTFLFALFRFPALPTLA